MGALSDTRPGPLSGCWEEEEIIPNCSRCFSRVFPPERNQRAISGFAMLVDKSCVAQQHSCCWLWDEDVCLHLTEHINQEMFLLLPKRGFAERLLGDGRIRTDVSMRLSCYSALCSCLIMNEADLDWGVNEENINLRCWLVIALLLGLLFLQTFALFMVGASEAGVLKSTRRVKVGLRGFSGVWLAARRDSWAGNAPLHSNSVHVVQRFP